MHNIQGKTFIMFGICISWMKSWLQSMSGTQESKHGAVSYTNTKILSLLFLTEYTINSIESNRESNILLVS